MKLKCDRPFALLYSLQQILGGLTICQALLLVLGEMVVNTAEGPSLVDLGFLGNLMCLRWHGLLEHQVNLSVHNSVKVNCSEVIMLELYPQRIAFFLSESDLFLHKTKQIRFRDHHLKQNK